MTIVHEWVKDLGELKLIGLRVLCPGEEFGKEIPKASLELDRRIGEIRLVKNPSVQIGAFIVAAQSEEEDGYWVCVEVTDFVNVPEGMMALTIPPQRYGSHRHRGPNHEIFISYNVLHNRIGETEYERAKEKWHLEIFTSWKDSHNLDVELLDTLKWK